jgi:hypothetical protein
MARKRWTPKQEITESLLKFREKRKWQLAFRRYIIEKNVSETYASYFGLDIETYRKWFEIQFTDGVGWENFGTEWQFGHILPLSCFDFNSKEDLTLCWSFINTRIEKLDSANESGSRIDLLSVRPYFEKLYEKTGFTLCLRMVEKIRSMEANTRQPNSEIEQFILQHKERHENLATLTSLELSRINRGLSLEELILEKEIFRKFG